MLLSYSALEPAHHTRLGRVHVASTSRPALSCGQASAPHRRQLPPPSHARTQYTQARSQLVMHASSEVADASETSLTKQFWRWQRRELGEHNIAYTVTGSGSKAVLLVHGFGASIGHYRKIIPGLVEQGYKVFAVDLLGFGASEKAKIAYSMDVWADQILDFQREFIGSPFVIVGNSLGSLASLMVARTLESEAPDQSKCVGLALLNVSGGMNNKAASDDWRIRLLAPLLLLIDWLLNQRSFSAYFFDAFRSPDRVRRVLLSLYPSNPAAVDDQLVKLLYEPSCDEGAVDVFVSVFTGPPGPRPEALADELHAPILTLWGTQDVFTPHEGEVGKFFQRLEQRKPNARTELLPGLGHCPFDEDPDLVLSHMLPWLAQHL